MMCEAYESQISALIDDELSAEERLTVLEHLSECPACKAYWEEQLLIRDALRAQVSAPAGFADAVMARVHATAQEHAAKKKVLSFRSIKRFAALAACCAVAALGIWAADLFPSMEDTALNNSAAPESYAMDMDNGFSAGASQRYGETGDAAECEAPEASAEADDAACWQADASVSVIATSSPVAKNWVEENLHDSWVSGTSYTLNEVQYRELLQLLEEAGETFNEITGENESGSYLLLAE